MNPAPTMPIPTSRRRGGSGAWPRASVRGAGLVVVPPVDRGGPLAPSWYATVLPCPGSRVVGAGGRPGRAPGAEPAGKLLLDRPSRDGPPDPPAREDRGEDRHAQDAPGPAELPEPGGDN